MQTHKFRKYEHKLWPEGDDDKIEHKNRKVRHHGLDCIAQLDFGEGADNHQDNPNRGKDEADAHGSNDDNPVMQGVDPQLHRGGVQDREKDQHGREPVQNGGKEKEDQNRKQKEDILVRRNGGNPSAEELGKLVGGQDPRKSRGKTNEQADDPRKFRRGHQNVEDLAEGEFFVYKNTPDERVNGSDYGCFRRREDPSKDSAEYD